MNFVPRASAVVERLERVRRIEAASMTDSSSQAAPRLRLAFVCSGDPLDMRTWSGTPAHMLQALRPHFDLVDVVEHPFPAWFLLLRRGLKRLTRGSIDLMWSLLWSSWIRRGIVKRLEKVDCDYVFAVAVTPLAAHFVSVKPTVFVSDTTQDLLSDYNPHRIRLAPWLKSSAAKLETAAIAGADVCFFPSDWARDSAITAHGGKPERLVTVPWGANLIADGFTPPETRSAKDWRLLFVGTDWLGKGGDIALATVAMMRQQGLNVHIDIVGSSPNPIPTDLEGVTFHGFLNKNDPGDRERLCTLYRAADVFFLPTRFDALGIVFAEAASYAVPSVSYDTGGVPAMVVDQVTGLLIKEGEGPAAFAEALTKLLSDRERYLRMCRAALERSHSTLNWEAWGRRIADELRARRKTSGKSLRDAA